MKKIAVFCIPAYGHTNPMLPVGYSLAVVILGNILFRFIDIKYLWIYIVLSIILSMPVNKLLQKAAYKRLVSNNRNRK